MPLFVFPFLPYWVWLVIAAFALLYYYLTCHFGYWEKYGVKCDKPIPLFGTIKLFPLKRSEVYDTELYKKYGKVFGIYEGRDPILYVADPELIKQITVKDFASFSNHRFIELTKKETLIQQMLFNMKGEEWKVVRNIISPTFTSGKLKQMVPFLEDCTTKLSGCFLKYAESGEPVNVMKYFKAQTVDVIANCAFGVNINSLDDPDNDFVINSQKLASPSLFVLFAIFLVPKLVKWLPPLFDVRAIQFFEKRVKQLLELRQNSQEHDRKDFLDLMLQAQKEDMQKNPSGAKVLTSSVITAQCFIFLFAGNETSAMAMSTMAYALALNPDIQEKLINEIDETMKNNGEKLSYEAVQKMSYLEKVILETLRMFPPVVRTDRQVTADNYELNRIPLKKDMLVYIPIYAIHYDEEYYPNPEKFDPERFETQESRNSYTFLPFGIGPRVCIGQRFAIMHIKLTMGYLLSQYRFVKNDKTEVPLKMKDSLIEFFQPESITLSIQKRTDAKYSRV